MLKIFYKDDLV